MIKSKVIAITCTVDFKTIATWKWVQCKWNPLNQH